MKIDRSAEEEMHAGTQKVFSRFLLKQAFKCKNQKIPFSYIPGENHFDQGVIDLLVVEGFLIENPNDNTYQITTEGIAEVLAISL